jgi:hypothetical protein
VNYRSWRFSRQCRYNKTRRRAHREGLRAALPLPLRSTTFDTFVERSFPPVVTHLDDEVGMCSEPRYVTSLVGKDSDRPLSQSSLVLISAESPCAIWISFELLSVHAVRSVTASITSRALG